jgi:hypothetical protein
MTIQVYWDGMPCGGWVMLGPRIMPHDEREFDASNYLIVDAGGGKDIS